MVGLMPERCLHPSCLPSPLFLSGDLIDVAIQQQEGGSPAEARRTTNRILFEVWPGAKPDTRLSPQNSLPACQPCLHIAPKAGRQASDGAGRLTVGLLWRE